MELTLDPDGIPSDLLFSITFCLAVVTCARLSVFPTSKCISMSRMLGETQYCSGPPPRSTRSPVETASSLTRSSVSVAFVAFNAYISGPQWWISNVHLPITDLASHARVYSRIKRLSTCMRLPFQPQCHDQTLPIALQQADLQIEKDHRSCSIGIHQKCCCRFGSNGDGGLSTAVRIYATHRTGWSKPYQSLERSPVCLKISQLSEIIFGRKIVQ